MRPLVTFIVPTVGRGSLERAVRSLQAQTLHTWEAIITFDGSRGDFFLSPEGRRLIDLISTDQRFTLLQVVRCDSAGLTRNGALDLLESFTGDRAPEWTAFLDDDDTLDPEYVQELNDYTAFAEGLVMVARMYDPLLGILPDPATPKLEWGGVGISFAYRWWLNERYRFRFIREYELHRGGPSRNEDIHFLKQILSVLHRHVYVYEDAEGKKHHAVSEDGTPEGVYITERVLYNVKPEV